MNGPAPVDTRDHPMRLLVTIPHYYRAAVPGSPGGSAHGSATRDPAPRVEALARAVASLYALFSSSQCQFRFDAWGIEPANMATVGTVDVLIFTAGGHHVVDRLPKLGGTIWHFDTPAEPTMLGFECHSALRQRLGAYDYYGYMEDDLILHDPWFFVKLAWFNGLAGDGALLQPNRFEVNREGPVYKAYIDGDFGPEVAASSRNAGEEPAVTGSAFGRDVDFRRASNPHSGCFFLNHRQMEAWASRPDFLDRDTSFIGPLESAATSGVMRAFRVYKPSRGVAGFLEIEHHGDAFLKRIGPGGRLR